MKRTLLLISLLIVSTFAIKNNLRKQDGEYKKIDPQYISNQEGKKTTAIDPKDVKTQGEFSNQAPDTNCIVTPEYAKPKAEIKLQIHGRAELQKNTHIATLQHPTVGRRMDDNTKQFSDVLGVEKDKVSIQTTKLVNTETNKSVHIDLLSGKHIPYDKNTAKPEFHGTERKDLKKIREIGS